MPWPPPPKKKNKKTQQQQQQHYAGVPPLTYVKAITDFISGYQFIMEVGRGLQISHLHNVFISRKF